MNPQVEAVNDSIAPEWGELLSHVENQVQAGEVSEQVEATAIGLAKIFPALFLNPGQLVSHLQELREPANGNSEPVKEAA